MILDLIENDKLKIVYSEEKETFVITVPKGIRFISDWNNYNLLDFNFPHILNKKIPGCGYTEYCINTKHTPVILCSPRVMLLENKFEQHPDIFYYKNTIFKDLITDKDLTNSRPGIPKELTQEEIDKRNSKIRESIIELEESLKSYLFNCMMTGKTPKILVTYDSFRHIKEYLIKENLFDKFYVVIDEFQSIFTDSRFKSTTELEFVNDLQDIQKLCFVSATPMINEYLKQIDEFKELPYFELDWSTEDPLRVIKPDLKIRLIESISSKSKEIIDTYKSGNFEIFTKINKETGEVINIVSNEAVFYVNSVKNICDIIKKNQLTPGGCNILCARDSDNNKKIREAFNSVKRELKNNGFSVTWDVPKEIIGKVPLSTDKNKMFTFCTRTVYLGADFYSKCARSFIFSDANIDSLAVDISLDLPQILGRQRDLDNPWKNRAEFYYKTLNLKNIKSQEEFDKYLENKIRKTESLLRSYDNSLEQDKHILAEQYEKLAKILNYKDQYVAVNHHSGSDIIPVFNNLVLVSEKRAFDIQQYDYKDRFSVFNSIQRENLVDDIVSFDINKFLSDFENLPNFYYKMKFLCESSLSDQEGGVILDQIPLTYKQFYEILGPEKLKALSYNYTDIRKSLSDLKFEKTNKEDLIREVYRVFQEGSRYTKSDIKETLRKIYELLGYNKTPKAVDIEEYFEIKRTRITNKTTGKVDEGFELIKKKKEEI